MGWVVQLPGVVVGPIPGVGPAIPIVGRHIPPIGHWAIQVGVATSGVPGVVVSAVTGPFGTGGPVAAVAEVRGGRRGWVAALVWVPSGMFKPLSLLCMLLGC